MCVAPKTLMERVGCAARTGFIHQTVFNLFAIHMHGLRMVLKCYQYKPHMPCTCYNFVLVPSSPAHMHTRTCAHPRIVCVCIMMVLNDRSRIRITPYNPDPQAEGPLL